jgi:hypothetical protein
VKINIKGFKINKNEIDKKVGNSRKFKEEARKLANEKLIKEKELMIQEFNTHPVTMELKAGAEGSNLSGTLGGYGNLFAFMGFPRGAKPTEEVLSFLQRSITIKGKGKTTGLRTEFVVNVPTIEDFEAFSMPWEGGNSWVKSIEKGMSSFSYFMHKAHQASRSGKGIQIDNKLHGSSSQGTPYMTTILNNFKKRLAK